VSKYLSGKICAGKVEGSSFFKKFVELKLHTVFKTDHPHNKNVLMALMQTKNKMKYTPFFNLCERDLRKVD
jgi:hypothetical protein